MLKRIQIMLQSCATDSPLFPPTILYNEGWLLRLVLDWFSTHNILDYPLTFPESARWFSEAQLPSTFLARYRGDCLAESWTHADGVIGHFEIGNKGKTDLSLLSYATHFVVCEAKLFSKLASGVKNADYFDQAARNVACIAEVLKRAKRCPSDLSHLGFYVLAPRSQITKGVFTKKMDSDSICRKVEQRVSEYKGAQDSWYSDWFQPTLQKIDVRLVSWEKIIAKIEEHDSASAHSIRMFYEQCIKFNHPRTK